MNIVRIVKNYLPAAECDELNAWVRDAISSNSIGYGVGRADTRVKDYDLRYTSRFYADRFEYPDLVRNIHARIESDYDLTAWHLPVHTHARDGTVVVGILPGGNVYSHTDPLGRVGDIHFPALHTLRCDILTQETSAGGGEIVVNGVSHKLEKGDMIQFLVSRHEHSVSTVQGVAGDLYVLWMFGWCVDGDVWESRLQTG
jgi:hypothetical protein